MQNFGKKNLAFSKEFIEALFQEKALNTTIMFCDKITIMVNDKAIPLAQENSTTLFFKNKKFGSRPSLFIFEIKFFYKFCEIFISKIKSTLTFF